MLQVIAQRRAAFTGGDRTGQAIYEQAAKSIKHVTLELGGSDPLIVCDDADLEEAVSAASVADHADV